METSMLAPRASSDTDCWSGRKVLHAEILVPQLGAWAREAPGVVINWRRPPSPGVEGKTDDVERRCNGLRAPFGRALQNRNWIFLENNSEKMRSAWFRRRKISRPVMLSGHANFRMTANDSALCQGRVDDSMTATREVICDGEKDDDEGF
jgi:hypothetical protein